MKALVAVILACALLAGCGADGEPESPGAVDFGDTSPL